MISRARPLHELGDRLVQLRREADGQRRERALEHEHALLRSDLTAVIARMQVLEPNYDLAVRLDAWHVAFILACRQICYLPFLFLVSTRRPPPIR